MLITGFGKSQNVLLNLINFEEVEEVKVEEEEEEEEWKEKWAWWWSQKWSCRIRIIVNTA